MSYNTAADRPQKIITPFDLALAEIKNFEMRLGLTILSKHWRDPGSELTFSVETFREATLEIVKRHKVEVEFIAKYENEVSYHEGQIDNARAMIALLR